MPEQMNKASEKLINTLVRADKFLYPTYWSRNFPLPLRIYTRIGVTESATLQVIGL